MGRARRGTPPHGSVLPPDGGGRPRDPAWSDTDLLGRFRLEAGAGPLTLVIREEGGASPRFLDGVLPREDLHIDLGEEGGGTLRGRVTTPGGGPAARVPVTAVRVRSGGERELRLPGAPPTPAALRHRNPAEVRSVLAGEDGSFHLGSPGGAWVVFAGFPGSGRAPGEPAVRREGDRSPLDLATGEGRTLRWRREAGDGPPPKGGRVEVRLEGYLPEGAPVLVLVRGPAPSLEIPGVPPGRAVVVVRDGEGREIRREER